MLVKRLVSIEDLGNIEVLFTDKTGTLTEGAITFDAALDAQAAPVASASCGSGSLCNEAMLDDGHVGRRQRARHRALGGAGRGAMPAPTRARRLRGAARSTTSAG